MKFYVYIENRMIAEVSGCEVAYEVYRKAVELADITGEIAYLADGETGEIIAYSDEFYNDELESDYDECGFDPYEGCYTYDC